MPDLIVAALIAGSVNAFGLVLQGWWFSTRIERLKLVGAERLAKLNIETITTTCLLVS
jgi:hypothetical protein